MAIQSIIIFLMSQDLMQASVSGHYDSLINEIDSHTITQNLINISKLASCHKSVKHVELWYWTVSAHITWIKCDLLQFELKPLKCIDKIFLRQSKFLVYTKIFVKK